jgi:glyoxylase-like metal-dependent hydrolase (beta-lactamase superfamily II)
MTTEPEIITVTPNIKLLHLAPPIPGYNRFIGPYLISDKKNAIVDIGPAAALPSLLAALNKAGVSPEDVDYILFTHIHIDHAGGVGGAIKAMPKARVVAHSRAHAHLVNPAALWESSLKALGDYTVKSGPIEPVPEDRIIDARDGMKIELGHGLILEVYLTPGHAAHHLSLFESSNSILFAGEAAGVCIDGKLRLATPPPFKLEVTLSSIDKLIALNPKSICYSHFGCYEDGLGRLIKYREKLLEWYELVNSEARLGKNPEEILMSLRKNDTDLDYLDALEKDVYSREISLINNSIRGLVGVPAV